MKAGDTALRAQRLNTTRRVLDFVPLSLVKIVLARTRWTPNFIVRGFTGSTQRIPLLGLVRTLTILPSKVKTTCSMRAPLTTTRNGVPSQPDAPRMAAVPRAHSSPPAGAGPGGGVHTTGST